VGLHELTRAISKLAAAGPEPSVLTPHQIHSVFKCIGQFVNWLLRKSQQDPQKEWLMADIFNFGTIVIRNQQLDFVPSHLI
jgi:hypothetical protein